MVTRPTTDPQSGSGEQALAALRDRMTRETDDPALWLALCHQLIAAGDVVAAREAQAMALRLRAAGGPGAIRRAAGALAAGRLPEAQLFADEMLRQYASDPLALRIAAEIAFRRNDDHAAVAQLERCLATEPDEVSTLFALALARYRLGDMQATQRALEALAARDRDNPAGRTLLASVLTRRNEMTDALRVYDRLLEEYPSNAAFWTLQGHALKSVGQQSAAIAAYRETIRLQPGHGEAWWSLANLKTVRFSAADAAAMERALIESAQDDEDRTHFHFALGKAYEDQGDHARAFGHYAEGNRLRLTVTDYDTASSTINLTRSRQVFTPQFFAARSGVGCPARDPIFIIGLPRSGSTLLEQILSSHPLVEGTMELPDLSLVARSIADRRDAPDDYDYVPLVPELDHDEWRRLGERYLETTRVHRKTDRPLFIDKMPNNFSHLGLLHLMLPNARIIDARRHPLAACFSSFKQHFAIGQLFTYGLENIGTYYRDYVALMAHFDRVLPGRVLRVHYERMVMDTEAEVRRLLDYCGLPFDPACLRFYENDRVVRTASSEQVRQPIYRDGVDHWRHFEPWLDPLKQILGPVLARYPDVPDFEQAGDPRPDQSPNR
ncbi:MAG: sulfotransferase [Gammaproteobacteria bacterium]